MLEWVRWRDSPVPVGSRRIWLGLVGNRLIAHLLSGERSMGSPSPKRTAGEPSRLRRNVPYESPLCWSPKRIDLLSEENRAPYAQSIHVKSRPSGWSGVNTISSRRSLV